MPITSTQIAQFGVELYDAWKIGRSVLPITDREPDITIEQAYQVQLETVKLRVASGSRIVGKKIGVTSKAVMDMLNVDQPDFGHMLSDMAYKDGAVVSLDRTLIPRGEGEIAFVMRHELMGPGLTNADVLHATDYVVPCFEIVDSRIKDWKIRIQDTVADNASSLAYVLGSGSAHPCMVDLVNVAMVLEKNGEVIGTGIGAATMGDPVTAVTWLANTLGRLGIPLKAGEVILSGSLSIMFPVVPGDSIRMSLIGIGSCSATFS